VSDALKLGRNVGEVSLHRGVGSTQTGSSADRAGAAASVWTQPNATVIPMSEKTPGLRTEKTPLLIVALAV
jgi:hypothetical protein